jgi:hypothetical protein
MELEIRLLIPPPPPTSFSNYQHTTTKSLNTLKYLAT